MRYVKELTLQNWGPFRGAHTIDLGPTVYAVVANHADDPERSNWIGKTWFLNSMLFALTGIKPDSCKAEDDWISHGESEGFVRLVCDDETIVKRARQRGRSTQLWLDMGGQESRQAAAQDNLYRAMGLNGSDILATCFVRQKEIARLITSDPAERTGIVNGWVELGPLQEAEAWLRAKLNELHKQERQLAGEVGEQPEGELAELIQTCEEADGRLKALKLEREGLAAQLQGMNEWQDHARLADTFQEVRAEGRLLRAEVDEFEAPEVEALEEVHSKAQAARGSAMDRERELRELLHGEWDGKCPLTCEDCTVEDAVRAVGASMEMELAEAEIVLDEADSAAQAAKAAHGEAAAACRAQARREKDLVQLRDKAKRLSPSVGYIQDKGEPPDLDDVAAQLTALDDDISTYERSVVDLEHKVKAHEDYDRRCQAGSKRQDELQGQIRIHAEAVAIVGRQGAQREVAEVALGRIERGANQLLTTAGIDLTVAVEWAREGRGLATHCDSCGSAHPTSQKVKTCGICGATRGPKMVEKMEIRPSDRSGAADDIAGLAFQMAASAWLRSKRSASWASTCIDEPFGALDAANSKALSSHLQALIRGNYAFDQGFLVAHDAQVMESLPAKVQIYGSEDGAAMEVI